MKAVYFIPTLATVLAVNAWADNALQRMSERLDDRRIQAENVEQHLPQKQPQAQALHTASKQGGTLSITKEELAQKPELVVRAMIPAVMQGHLENVELLYPIYQNIPSEFHDPLLTKWAEAILAKKRSDYRQAITIYRQIIAENSEIIAIRLQLAAALFENNELEAAEDQFKKLRAEPLPNEVQAVVNQYLSAITQRDRWTFSGGLTYLNDPNINNAPKAGTIYGNWTAPSRESAEGMGFNLNIAKKWSWGNGFFNEIRLNGHGKYYWDNRKYNEITGRGSIGLGFQNAKASIAVLPFIEQNLYAGGSILSETLKRFSKAGGAALEASYWLSPQWQWNANYEYYEQRYTTRKHLNGNTHFVSTGLLYLANAKHYWFVNMNYNRTATRDKDDAYFRRGIHIGWGQEWDKGLSTRLSASVAQKRYKAPMPIFNITQRNKEYGIQAAI